MARGANHELSDATCVGILTPREHIDQKNSSDRNINGRNNSENFLTPAQGYLASLPLSRHCENI